MSFTVIEIWATIAMIVGLVGMFIWVVKQFKEIVIPVLGFEDPVDFLDGFITRRYTVPTVIKDEWYFHPNGEPIISLTFPAAEAKKEND